MAKLTFAQKFKSILSGRKFDEDFFDDLTDALVEGDIGAKNAFEISERLQENCKKSGAAGEDDVKNELEKILLEYLRTSTPEPQDGKTNVFLMLGVNGVGKTTTAAKLARFYREKGVNVTLAAADTFRAAAEEQLQMHGDRLGIRVVAHQHGSDPSSVVFDAADSIRAAGGGLVIADTAGRLHNKENLVKELQKIEKIASQKSDSECCKKILVIDSTTGQNALRQAEVFNEAVKVDFVILTKCDSTAKGGAAFAIGKELGIPLAFVCNGEHYENIAAADAEDFTRGFLGK